MPGVGRGHSEGRKNQLPSSKSEAIQIRMASAYGDPYPKLEGSRLQPCSCATPSEIAKSESKILQPRLPVSPGGKSGSEALGRSVGAPAGAGAREPWALSWELKTPEWGFRAKRRPRLTKAPNHVTLSLHFRDFEPKFPF